MTVIAEVYFPSVQLDDGSEDVLGATYAEIIGSAIEPFGLVDGQTVAVDLTFPAVDTRVATFVAGDFVDIAAASTDEVVAVLNAALGTWARAENRSGAVAIVSTAVGSSPAVAINAGSSSAAALLALGLSGAVPTAGLDSQIDALVVNRVPTDGENGAALDAGISFDAIVLTAPVSALTVTVDGVLAYDSGAGGAQPGWSAVVTAIPGTANSVHVDLVPTVPFVESSTVSVVVDVYGLASDSWSFRAYDQSPPILESVVAIDDLTIRVTFAEDVFMGDGTGDDDALNPDAYGIERKTVPAYVPSIIAVEQVASDQVDLTVDEVLTFGAPYLLVIGPIADLFGNAALSPNNAFDFTAYLPPFPAGRRFVLREMVPSLNFAEDVDGSAEATVAIFQEIFNVLLLDIDRWSDIFDPDKAPEAFVDAMLDDLGNQLELDLSLLERRKLVKLLVPLYKKRGTTPGIVDGLRLFLGLNATVTVFNGNGWKIGRDKLWTSRPISLPTPDNIAIVGPGQRAIYYLRVDVDTVLTATQREQALAVIQLMKASREHLSELVDATPVVAEERWWRIGHTRIGYARIHG